MHINKKAETTFPQLHVAPPGVRTSLTQSLVDEVGCRAEVGGQVKVFAVGRRDAVILQAHIAVELRPRINVLWSVSGVQHMCYPQIGQQGLLLGSGTATENRIN